MGKYDKYYFNSLSELNDDEFQWEDKKNEVSSPDSIPAGISVEEDYNLQEVFNERDLMDQEDLITQNEEFKLLTQIVWI